MLKPDAEALREQIEQRAAFNLNKLVGEGKTLARASRLAKGETISYAAVNSAAEKIEATKDLVGERGIGTFLDIPVNLARMLPGMKKILPDDKYKDLLYAYQSKIVKADHAAGEALSKNKILKKVFTTTDLHPEAHVVTEKGNVVQAFVPKETQRLSAPIDKAKNFAIPMLTLYGVDKVVNPGNDNKDEKVAQELHDLLVEKVATTLMNLSPAPVLTPEALEKIAKASDMLKVASEKISSLEGENERLASEIDSLKQQIFAKERAGKATKLAQEMITKGLIKQAALASQVDYIMGLDDEGFKVLNKTVRDVPVKKASTNVDAVEKLSFLMTDPYTDSQNEQPSLEEAIIRLGK